MAETVPLVWAVGVAAAGLVAALLLSFFVCLLAGLALYLQKQNLERLMAMTISRKAAETFAVADAPVRTPPPVQDPVKRAFQLHEQAKAEMRAKGMDPSSIEDRLDHMERVAARG